MSKAIRILMGVIIFLILVTGCKGSDPETMPPVNSSSSSGSSSGGGVPGTDTITIQENEAGFCHVDGVIAASGSGFAGSGYADPANDQTNGIDWRVNVPSAGTYTLTFRYASTTLITSSVAVNEASMTAVSFGPTGSLSDWVDVSVDVTLEAGDNDINLGTPSGSGNPNIDSLTVTGNSPQAVACAVDVTAQNTAACNALTGPASSTIDPDALMGFAGVSALGVATTTGGGSATPVTVDTNSASLAAAVSGDTPKVVQVSGTLTGSGMIDVGSNTTIAGLGTNATLDGFGLRVDGENNVIITNLTFTGSSDDGITIEDNAHHVWAHHNRFEPNTDGALDIRRGSSYITVAWNHFIGTDKTMLVGSNETEYETLDSKVTYHHNWFDGTVQRNPRIRFADVHIFNNYYDGVTSYGVVSVQFADVLFEGNYLDLASAGNRAASTGGVAESPHKGDIVACNNAEISGVIETRGLAFDPGLEYSYNMQDATTVPATVMADAGPQ